MTSRLGEAGRPAGLGGRMIRVAVPLSRLATGSGPGPGPGWRAVPRAAGPPVTGRAAGLGLRLLRQAQPEAAASTVTAAAAAGAVTVTRGLPG